MVASAAAVVLSAGLIVAIEDSLDAQPVPIITSDYAQAFTQYDKYASAPRENNQVPTPITTKEQTVVVPTETQAPRTTASKPPPISRTQTVAPPPRVASPTPKPVIVAPLPQPKPAVDSSIVGVARSWLGKNIPYLYGGGTLNGMDCSHFIWEVLKDAGYNVPYRNSAALKDWTIPISRANALPGDLVFWYSPTSHAGIYAGNNQVIDHGSGYGPKLRSLWGSPTFGRIP